MVLLKFLLIIRLLYSLLDILHITNSKRLCDVDNTSYPW